jgi:hypothetical protein
MTYSGYPSPQSFGRPAPWLPARLATILIEDACALERVGCSRGGSFSRLPTGIPPGSFNPLPHNPLQCAFTRYTLQSLNILQDSYAARNRPLH